MDLDSVILAVSTADEAAAVMESGFNAVPVGAVSLEAASLPRPDFPCSFWGRMEMYFDTVVCIFRSNDGEDIFFFVCTRRVG